MNRAGISPRPECMGTLLEENGLSMLCLRTTDRM